MVMAHPAVAGAPQHSLADVMPDASDAEHLDLVAVVRATVVHFIEQGRGEAAEDFTDHTPFMDAGLDSLDVMKVRRLSFASRLIFGQGQRPSPVGTRSALICMQSRKAHPLRCKSVGAAWVL